MVGRRIDRIAGPRGPAGDLAAVGRGVELPPGTGGHDAGRRVGGRRGGPRPAWTATATATATAVATDTLGPAPLGRGAAAGLCPLGARLRTRRTAGVLGHPRRRRGLGVGACSFLAAAPPGNRHRKKPIACAWIPAQAISPSPSATLSPLPPDGLHPSDWPSEEADADAVPAEDVLQQLTLSQDAAGGQRLCGWLRLRLAAGQRSGVVHVAFCPPFSRTPELSLEQLDGPAARVRTAQLLPHGVRLDLKLAVAASSGGSVLLRFAAWTEEGSA